MNLTNNYRVNLWGTRFGTELWESLTRATRRDEIQKVSSEIYYRIHKANIKLLVVILQGVPKRIKYRRTRLPFVYIFFLPELAWKKM